MTDFLAEQDAENTLRVYMMLRPSQVNDLHRGSPSVRTETCIHNEYTATEAEWWILQQDYLAYIRAGSIAPLTVHQLTKLDCRFNSKAARMALRERGPLQSYFVWWSDPSV